MIVMDTREMPFSEVCMHMRIAGLRLEVLPLPGGMAQLYRSGDLFSFPITWGEAGISRCATVGCTHSGSKVIEWGEEAERHREVVCDPCGEGYLCRPVLHAVEIHEAGRFQ